MSVNSNPRLRAVDLQLATYDQIAESCGTYTEDLTVSWSTSMPTSPGQASSPLGFFCLKNNGGAAIQLQVTSRLLAQNDPACTGDEADYDADCGVNGTGDLNNPLGLSYPLAYYTPPGGTGCSAALYFGPDPQNFTSGCNSWTSLAPGAHMVTAVWYQTAIVGGPYSQADFERAQSDSVRFELEFEASIA